MKKQKALIFFSYLAPWRIDVFNEMASYYDMTIVFTSSGQDGFTYDTQNLLGKFKSNIKVIFLKASFYIGFRPILFGVRKLLNTECPDVIFSHEYSPISARLILYKKLGLYNYKYYATTSDNVIMAKDSSGLKAMSRDYVLQNCDGAIVYSKLIKAWYLEKYPHLKVDICPNIQNPDTLNSYKPLFPTIIQQYKDKFNLNNCKILLFIGRITDVKGVDLLIEAYAKAKMNGYKLVLVGKGEQESVLREKVVELNIADQVVFVGFYTEAELYAWYFMANLFILPSRYEPFGAVINEALVLGCPVIASKYIGALEFVDSQNGYVFDPLNEEEFISVLIQAESKFSNFNKDRKDLMTCSFKNHVDAFVRVTL